MKFPCKNCEKRTQGCHSRCLDYISAKQVDNNRKRVIAEAKREDSAFFGHIRDKNTKLIRKHIGG